jgi:RNA recognition motif-containing protein
MLSCMCACLISTRMPNSSLPNVVVCLGQTKRTKAGRHRACNSGVSDSTPYWVRENSCRTRPRSTLFVSNLPFTATSTDLRTLFSDIGPVRSAFVVLDRDSGVSKGVGYVSFAIKEDAKAAIEQFDSQGIVLDGRALRVQLAASKARL